MSQSPSDIAATATRLWHREHGKALRGAVYKAAVENLDVDAKKIFDAKLLALATESRQILKPDLPKVKRIA
jgi:hypothetical protein